MPQPPRNDGWKHTSKPNPAKPPVTQHTPNASRRPWQPGAAKPKTTAKATSRVAKFVAAGVGVGLLTAVVVWVILLLLPPNYPSLVVVAMDSPNSLAIPENAAGVNTAKAVGEWAKGGGERAKLSADHEATRERDAWRAKLNGNDKGTVLYFAAHTGADAGAAPKKGPYLWQPPKGGAVSDADKLYVADILQRLDELPKSQPKLLVIDITQTPANWAFGGAYSDFIRAVKAMDADIEKVGGLTVLLSADDDQVSWVADERRMTAFGYYFTEGLRGAAGTPGGPVTVATLHTYLKAEVQKWAVANRGENQEPVLLPKASGAERADKLKLATLPTTAYTAPSAPEPAAPTPPALLAEWKRAGDLARSSPAPDTTDPLKWRQYSEWLMRSDRLVRLNAVPDTLPPRVKRLGDELEARAADDVVCGTVALPAGVALSGVPAEKPADTTFLKLWEPSDGSDHPTEWAKLLKDVSGRKETDLRAAVARFVMEKVLADGVSRASLDTADKVLKAVGGVPPVEAHFIRMLHLHLPGEPKTRTANDVKLWPSSDLLRTAITLRRTAEEAAWADGLAYPEQAFRWTFPLVTAADAQRQTGEDLLFDTDPKTRQEAEQLFLKAGLEYGEARQRAKTVADALALRDKVFARLPYYARWVAAARGGPTNAEELLGKLERAATAAHQIDKLVRDVPAAPTREDVNNLLAASKEAAALEEVAQAYDTAAKQLSDQAQESNWHTLDAAQVVPFRTLDLGPDLAQKARTAAATLAAKPLVGSRTTDPDALTSAGRHLRAAAAYLNDPTFARGSTLGEKPVKLADQLAEALHGLAGKATTAANAADARDKLQETATELAEANRLARLCDPAAPVGGAPTPPEADRRFWRHYLLLAHAKRITLDGWCSDNPREVVVRWYCTLAAGQVFVSADAELLKLVPARASLPPARQDRLTEDLRGERKRTPTELDVRSAQTRVIVPDERHLRYTYEAWVIPDEPGKRIGLPVAEYALPAALAKVNPNFSGRRLERRLATEKAGTVVPQTATFAFSPSPAEGGADTLAAALRYRGRVYRADTELTFADKPNLRLENVPPTGNAVMALQADPDAVNGAVTLLLDLTNSMDTPVPGTKNNRLEEAFIGIEELLKRVPPGTQLRIGTFVGSKPDGGNFALDVRTLVPEFRVLGGAQEVKRVMGLVRGAKLVDPSCTPVAEAIAFAFRKEGAGLWPKNFTGGRTLIVLTDGDDNWEEFGKGYTDRKGRKATPGDVVKEAITDAVLDPDAADVTVHLALFAMDAKAVERAKEQFEYLVKADDLQDRGRFRLAAKVKDGADFAAQLAQAVMPRVRYKSDRAKGVMVASLKDQAVYNPTPALKPSSFTLTDGVNKLPLVQLDAGERVIVRAVRKGERILLTRPPLAYELAQEGNGLYNPKPEGMMAITVPELKYERTKPRSRIDAVLTLEELDPALANDLLKAPSRYFAWFDFANPDGGAFDLATGPQILVRNHLEAPGLTTGGRAGHELLAPAWDVEIKGWHEPRNGKDADRYSRPKITASWLNGLPDPLDVQNVTPSQVMDAAADTLPLKAFKFGPGKVPVLDAAVVERDRQFYLTVWMDYQKPGELVLLRVAGDWKGGRVAESHTYYDKHHRYTAEFGPFTAADLVTPLRLELYSVADLRKFSADKQRAVTLKGDAECTDRFTLPRRLFLTAQE